MSFMQPEVYRLTSATVLDAPLLELDLVGGEGFLAGPGG
jgi:hypothetical protein